MWHQCGQAMSSGGWKLLVAGKPRSPTIVFCPWSLVQSYSLRTGRRAVQFFCDFIIPSLLLSLPSLHLTSLTPSPLSAFIPPPSYPSFFCSFGEFRESLASLPHIPLLFLLPFLWMFSRPSRFPNLTSEQRHGDQIRI